MPEYRHTFDRPDCVLLSVKGTFCVPFCRSARLSALSAIVFLRSAFSVSAFCAFLLSAQFYYEKGKNAMKIIELEYSAPYSRKFSVTYNRKKYTCYIKKCCSALNCVVDSNDQPVSDESTKLTIICACHSYAIHNK